MMRARMGVEIGRILGRVFRPEWPPIVSGIVLGALLFVRYRPPGVVGKISRWSTDVLMGPR